MHLVLMKVAWVCLCVENCRVFVIDLLNFSFWTEEDRPKYCVSYAGREWTGYWSLCAAFNRAIDVCWSAFILFSSFINFLI